MGIDPGSVDVVSKDSVKTLRWFVASSTWSSGDQEEDEEDVAECRWGTRSLERGHPPHCPPPHSATRLCCLINNGKIIFEEIPEVVNQVYHWHELFASPDPGPACCHVWGWDRRIFAYKTLSGLAPKKLVFGYAVNGEICLEKVSLAKFSAVGCQVWTRCLHDKFIFHIWFTFCEVGTARKCNM